MELLTGSFGGIRIFLSLFIVSVSPWIGFGVYNLAPSEVAFAKKYLRYAYGVLFALAGVLFFRSDVGFTVVASAVILLACALWFHPLLSWPWAGFAGVGAFLSGRFEVPSMFAIAGIIVGSLDHKRRDLFLATVGCVALGLLAWFAF